MNLKPSFWSELKRRNVVRVAAAYAVVAWLLIEVSDTVFPRLGLPDWTVTLVIAMVILGFPLALFLSWAFELTPEGVKRSHEVQAQQSIAPKTGRHINRLILAGLVAVIAVMAVERVWFAERQQAALPNAAVVDSGAPQTAGGKSIAVLPFTNMSADPENEYFADGLSEELLNQLAQIPDLMVSGRTSSFSFKGRNEDLRSIGSTLGVANVLEGSVRRQGDQVRVTTQLIRVSDGFHLWSNTYDRLIEDVFAIQDDIARNVATAMKIVLDEASRQSMQEAGVRNVEAFIAFQKGTQLFEKAHGSARLIETLAEGMTHFDRAIALVPEFGAAYWHKSDYYAHILIETDSSGEQRIQALSDLRKVLDAAYEHSPNAGRRAFIDVDRVLFSADWTPLRARIEKALAATGCPDPTWIQLADIMGYAEAMARMWERYLRCEPLNAIGYAELSTSYLISGRPEQALEQIAVALEQLGNHPWLSWARQNTLLHLGRIDEALTEAPLFIDEEDFVGIRAEAAPLALAGKADDALAAMAAWVEDHGPEPRASISILAAAGQRQQANEVAAMIDARPAGPLDLLTAIYNCLCGAPFDLEATPNLQARIGESGVPWPPPRLIDYPAKDW